MWGLIQAGTEYVLRYGTPISHFWFLIMFIGRFIMLCSVCGQVYADERWGMICDLKNNPMRAACESQCFNTLGMSPVRFWAFQILASVIPGLAFNSVVSHIEGKLSKRKQIEEEIEKRERQEEENKYMDKEVHKYQNKCPNNTHQLKKRFFGGDEVEIVFSRDLQFLFLGSLVIRGAIELTSMYLGSPLFHQFDIPIVNGVRNQTRSSFANYLYPNITGIFYCGFEGDNAAGSALHQACHTHFAHNGRTNLLCYMPRPSEKTVLIRYLNGLSMICLCLTALEILIMMWKLLREKIPSKYRNFKFPRSQPYHFYDSNQKRGSPPLINNGGVRRYKVDQRFDDNRSLHSVANSLALSNISSPPQYI